MFLAPPGPLTSCVIRLPKDQERHSDKDNKYQHHYHHYHQRHAPPDNNSAEDIATISCDLGNDGGIRPLTYSLEIYESDVMTTMPSTG